jgi:hypothetical protein
MLKKTKIQLELIHDVDMYQFIEKGLRGGVSNIAHRYSKAYNKYMKDYDESKPSSYIMYLDANNLYGWAMSQLLPTGNFKWEKGNVNLAEYTRDDAKRGIILEVDLEYPNELHDLHNGYPLAPESEKVDVLELSEYCTKIKDKFNIPNNQIRKLIPTLNNNKKLCSTL